MRYTSWLALGTFVALWVGCEAETVSDDADAGPAGAAGSGAASGASGGGAGGGAAGTGGESTECEAIPQLPAECNACVQEKCQQPCADMQNHPEAAACSACAEACANDEACSDACYAECPGYVEAGETFVACMESKCCETCTSGMCTACSITTNDDECDACMHEACLDACVSLDKLGVTEYFQCQNECEDDACLEGCDAAHPEVASANKALLECTLTACPEACGDVLGP